MAMRIEEVRGDLVRGLRRCQPEIEQAVLVRVYGVCDPAEVKDPLYTEGLRAAVTVAIQHGIEALERSEGTPPPIPTLLLSQARLAARCGVNLDTVLRRYFAGYSILGDFVLEQAERSGMAGGAALKRLLRTQAGLFDRLLAAVSEEYEREASIPASSEQRRVTLVQRLLDGELLDPRVLGPEFGYEPEQFHVGLIAFGPDCSSGLQEAARSLDLQTMAVRRGEDTTWAWFGSRLRFGVGEALASLGAQTCAELALAIGEVGQGPTAWRLSHRQALAALPIALRRPGTPVRYVDVALQASMLRDEVLVDSLRELYLVPLAQMRDGGEMARLTLRAYFEADRNVSSAAEALGVSRSTVANRLRAIEKALERPLSTASEELAVALRIDEQDQFITVRG
ncbi:MAG TPA: helix-turn-helix domain-containing protein [Solirubrobacterales bacterium]|nr:helix-turn-helix domain-containing protein [Solirubrobacterales bacterium]